MKRIQNLPPSVGGFALLVFLLAVSIATVVPVKIASYLALPLILASVVYPLLRLFPGERGSIAVGRRARTVFDVVVFGSVTLLALVGRWLYPDQAVVFVGLFLVVVGILSVRIFVGPDRVVVLQILCLGVVARATFWFAIPVLGKDVTRMLNSVGHISATGTLMPSAITYYQWFPLSHVLASTALQITGLAPKHGYFTVTSIALVLSLGMVYLVVIYFVDPGNRTVALFALLFAVAASTFLMRRGALPKAQTVATALIPFILYLTVSAADRRNLIPLLVLFGALVLVHNFAPMFVTGFAILWLLVARLYSAAGMDYLRPNKASLSSRDAAITPIVIGVFLISMIQYLRTSHYLNNRVGQIFAILTFDRNILIYLANPAINKGGGGIQPTVSTLANTAIVFDNFDALLRQAGGFLVQAFIMTVATYVLLESLLAKKDDDILARNWVTVGVVLFAGFSFSLLMSFGGFTRRAADSVALVTAPIAGLLAAEFEASLGTVGRGLVVAVFVTGAFFAVTHPGVAITERDPGFEPALTSSETAAFDFLSEYDLAFYSTPYFTGRYYYFTEYGTGQSVSNTIRLRSGDIPGYTIRSAPTDRPFVYRTYYRSYRGDTIPPGYDTVYSSGDIQVVDPS